MSKIKINNNKLDELMNSSFSSYDKYEVTDNKICLYDKRGMKLIINAYRHSTFNLWEDETADDYFHKWRFAGKSPVDLKDISSSPFEHLCSYMVGKFYFQNGQPVFEEDNNGRSLLLKIRDCGYISKEKRDKYSIKYITKKLSVAPYATEALVIMKADDDFGESYRKAISNYYRKIDEEYEENKKEFNRNNPIREACKVLTDKFTESLNTLMDDNGISKKYTKPHLEHYCITSGSAEMTFSFKDEGFCTIHTGFQNYKFKNPLSAEDLKVQLKEVLEQEKKHIQKALELKKDMLEPVYELVQRAGADMFRLEGLDICTKETWGYNYYADDDRIDDGWVDNSHIKKELITEERCREMIEKVKENRKVRDYLAANNQEFPVSL